MHAFLGVIVLIQGVLHVRYVRLELMELMKDLIWKPIVAYVRKELTAIKKGAQHILVANLELIIFTKVKNFLVTVLTVQIGRAHV